jgi:DeoR/GlpR family transcriptional regulator of sugar metabolism
MLVEERRTKIVRILREHGRVRVKDLSERFQTSEVTIRNDLNTLQQLGLARRGHGGAYVPDDLIGDEPPFFDRASAQVAEKARIGAAAAALVRDGETIVLDSGTTTQEIAKRIKMRQGLCVLTNGVNVATELLGAAGVQVIILGGALRPDSFSVVGHFAEQMLEEVSADKVFIGAAGCDTVFGLSTPTMEESRVTKAMVQVARERILVADSSKFGRRSLSRIAALADMHKVITDRALPEAIQQEIRRIGLELILV